MDILKKFIAEAKKVNGSVIFPEGDEERTLAAAARLAKDGICKPFVVAAQREIIEKTASKNKLDISGIEIIVPNENLLKPEIREAFTERMLQKGKSADDVLKLIREPLYFSALYVKSDKASACVAGARSATADVLRAAIYGIGVSPGTGLISSFFLMIAPDNHPLVNRPIIYADCAVNPDPGSSGLTDIAVSSVKSFKVLFPGEESRVAFLSFSTKGSAEHPSLKKIREAVKNTTEYFKDDNLVKIDGEMQFDAAIVPSVAQKKSPGSLIGGNANIFIFPDLNAGNICYKVTERLGLFTATGPMMQGLAKPMNDLSRGCSIEDIYNVAAISVLRSRMM